MEEGIDPSELQKEIVLRRMSLIKEIGLLAYRFLITLNAGAFIVLLTFVGNVGGSGAFSFDLTRLKWGLFCFLAAIGSVFVSMTIAYLSAQLQLLGKNLPFANDPAGFIAWLVTPVVVSMLFFFGGAVAAITGITT
jgi:hypothetical protein